MSEFLTQKQAIELMNVSRMTLLRWEERGILHPVRLASGHRRYSLDEIRGILGEGAGGPSGPTKCVIYARVSTRKQQESGNLERQVERLEAYARSKGYEIVRTYEEVASGINENRRQLEGLLKKVASDDIDIVLAEYKDRIARFGFSYIQTYCSSHQTTIELLENAEEKSLNEEMVEDMISIITSFSARLYGQRGAKKVKKQLDELSDEND